ncbi:MAG: FAD-dependent oxidoreductase [Deltaproteobacteria bacterium]|nr:FAD-dependent oxidoreductase [Deltaproteobacteria bacterium]
MSQNPDIIVVGGGVIGLACAWKLAQQSYKVTLLERSECGSESSSASLGVLAPSAAKQQQPSNILHGQSLGMFTSFISELEAASGLSVPLYRRGSLRLLAQETSYQNALTELESAKHLPAERAQNYELELLTPKQLLQVEPALQDPGYGALLNRAVSVVEVPVLIEALIRACKSAGVDIRTGTTVSGLTLERSSLTVTLLHQENICAKQALICAGVWTMQLHPLLARYCALEPVRGQALEIASPEWSPRHIIKSKRAYLVPAGKGRILLGSTTEFNPGFNSHNTFHGLQEIWGRTSAVVPRIASYRVTRYWAGLRPAALDRKLFLGEVPETENLFVASGHYKTGFGFMPITAKIIAQLMTDGETEYKLDGLLPRVAKAWVKGKNGRGCSS